MFTFTTFDSVSVLSSWVVKLKKTLALNVTQVNYFLFVTGILTVLSHKSQIILFESLFHSIILMYFVYQTHILTLPKHLMIKILKFMDITYYGLIMHLIVRVVVFVYIIKVHCFEIYWCLLFTRMLSFCNFNSWEII